MDSTRNGDDIHSVWNEESKEYYIGKCETVRGYWKELGHKAGNGEESKRVKKGSA